MNNVSNSKTISVAMISNAMNHHQFPFCDSMDKEEGIQFTFIATKPIAKERLEIGFKDLNSSRDYIVRSYESDEEYKKAMKIVNDCDYVIYGSAQFEFIKNRLKNKKWTFIYSERLFKEVRGKDFLNIKTILACILRYSFVSHQRLRLLCSSAFSSNDFRFFGFKEKQAYKWGYFPPVSKLEFEDIENKKKPCSIVWVGRMVVYKHPELVVNLAKKLDENAVDFSMTLVGDGPLLNDMKQLADKYNISDKVTFLGAVSTDKARDEMEKAEILVTTSDHNEGWGAIVNEGMASGCAVVASHLMGSVPYMINDKENGFVFESGNAEDLYSKVRLLLTESDICSKISKNAYESIINEYNGEVAAKRLAQLMRAYADGKTDFAFENGICSIATHIKNNWYKG